MDPFQRNDTVSPGIITGLQPHYVQREDLSKEIKEAIENLEIPDNEIIDKWIENNNNTEGEDGRIPKFRLIRSVENMEN